MKLSMTFSALTAAIGLVLSGVAFAAPPPPVEASTPDQPVASHGEVNFETLDKDADGFVLQSDLPPGHALALQFAAADLDGDQRLGRDEFEAFRAGPVEPEKGEPEKDELEKDELEEEK